MEIHIYCGIMIENRVNMIINTFHSRGLSKDMWICYNFQTAMFIVMKLYQHIFITL